MQRIAFINSFSLFFGCDPFSRSNNFPEGSYQKAFGELEDALFRRYVVPKIYWKLQRRLSIGIEGRLKRIIQLFEQFFNQSILLKREEHSTRSEIRKDDDNANSDVLTSYLEDEEKEAKISGSLRPQSDKFLRDTALNFVAAGIASVSACLAWFFRLVATHPSEGWKTCGVKTVWNSSRRDGSRNKEALSMYHLTSS
ncbi:Cytochrome P450 [Morus notabilis]|uniref:Cytochrome P450 n=1 Tax=Morus notabilis TaxID=981085 RepID=W9SE45_9ROSA|nr:Cytochrome P450 [Morus notabilis]